jgi:hypothetical protein
MDEPERGEVEEGAEMATVFRSSAADAEIEANVIRGVLDANEIPSVLQATPYHSLEFAVKVPATREAEAEALLAEAQASGPEAAVEAEAASENGAPTG